MSSEMSVKIDTSILHNTIELASQFQRFAEGLTLHPDVKPLRLQLAEVLSQSKALATDKDYDISRGTYLLAHGSNNPEHTGHALGLLHLSDLNLSLSSHDTDLVHYVRHTKEKNIMAIIEARRRESQADFYAFVQAKLAVDWQSQKTAFVDQYKKQKMSNSRGQQTTTDSVLNKTINSYWAPYEGSSTVGFTDVVLQKEEQDAWSAKEQTFVQAISSLNEHRRMKQSVAIASLMSQLTRSLGTDLHTNQLADAWQMLSFVADEKHMEHGKITVGRLLHSRQYANEYAAKSNSSVVNRSTIEGSKRYLEDQFFALIEREIARFPQQARFGGLPTIEGKVKAYVNLRLQKNGSWTMPDLELVNNVPVWAILFYFIRAGFLAEAAQYTARNEMLFSKLEKNWYAYITAYTDDEMHDLPRPLAERLHTEYNQRFKYGHERIDPYKQALFKIIGRCDLSHRTLSAILPVTEDWMWLQMSLLRETGNQEGKFEHYSLRDLQDTLLHYGERHFNPKNTNPMLYFQMLLLSGQFERAVHNLASKSWTDAVHFAVVLAYYGLLRISKGSADRSKKMLLDNDDDTARLNFAELLQAYIAQIKTYSSTAAVEYTTLICLNSDLKDLGRSQIEACHSVLRSLVLDTRDFATLLGDIRADGTRDAGFIEKRLPLLELQDESDYLRTITEQAAAISEKEGRMADAILLYHLSEEYDIVVNLVNNFLGAFLLEHSILEATTQEPLSMTTSQDAPALARTMLLLYRNNAALLSGVSQSNIDSCKMLLAMVESKVQFKTGNYSASIATIDQLNILPMADNISVGAIKELANSFSLLDESVARNVPNLLLLTIRCLKARCESLSSGEYNDQSRKSQLQAVKLKARNLNTFAGLIKYQMSEEVRVTFETVAASIR